MWDSPKIINRPQALSILWVEFQPSNGAFSIDKQLESEGWLDDILTKLHMYSWYIHTYSIVPIYVYMYTYIIYIYIHIYNK